MMLNHIGQQDVAEKVINAWACTIEDGIHTADIYKEGVSKQKVSTSEFADIVITNLGQNPQSLTAIHLSEDAGQIMASNPGFYQDLYTNRAKACKGVVDCWRCAQTCPPSGTSNSPKVSSRSMRTWVMYSARRRVSGPQLARGT